jgi:sugar O-acyltransferase (sialic acid O-acetyltransferase NeuD family)
MDVLILGAGGHAKVVADILQLQGVKIIGLLDDAESSWGTDWFGLPVLGGIDTYAEFDVDGLIIAIGSNQAREKIAARIGTRVNWVNAIHPAAVIARSARLGVGTVVTAQAVVNPDARVGSHAIINTCASVDHDCTIGDYAHIAPGVHLAGGVEIGKGVLMGIGSQAVPNCRVGDWAIIGAGATLVHDMPAGAVARGTPAREFYRIKPV